VKRSAHIVEVGGLGGVYQHAVTVAEIVAARGVPVVLHTATDAELEPDSSVKVCRCVRWFRSLRPRFLRPPLIALFYVLGTLPHLALRVRSGDAYHFQGEFKSVLTTLGLMLQRALPRRRVVQSRHNTFSRHGTRLDYELMRCDARICDATIVFTEPDEQVVRAWGGCPVRSPLAQYVPAVDPAARERWRELWGGPGTVLLFAGQVRADKRLDLLLEAAALVPEPVRVAVVGEDLGEAERCRALAAELGVDVSWSLEYVALDEFAAAIEAADVVVCCYDVASQSGVLAVARSVGTVTLATDVGGLSELANVTVPPGDAAQLAEGIQRAQALRDRPAPSLHEQVASAHLVAYGFNGR
jgi:glycosyltransferase involved in cell wall biosynthesis